MTKYFTQFDESTQTIGTNLAGWTTRGTVAPSSYAPAYGTPAGSHYQDQGPRPVGSRLHAVFPLGKWAERAARALDVLRGRDGK